MEHITKKTMFCNILLIVICYHYHVTVLFKLDPQNKNVEFKRKVGEFRHKTEKENYEIMESDTSFYNLPKEKNLLQWNEIYNIPIEQTNNLLFYRNRVNIDVNSRMSCIKRTIIRLWIITRE